MGMLWSPSSLVFPISIWFELMLPGESPFSHSDYIIFYFKVLHLLTCFIVFFGHLFLFWGFFCWERSVFLLDSLPLANLPLLLFALPLISDLDHFSFSPASLIFLLKASWTKKQGQDISFLQIPPKVQPLWQCLWPRNRITMWLCITWIYFENNVFVYSPDKGLFVEAFFKSCFSLFISF